MEVLHSHCAALDVHKDTVVACIRHMVDGKIGVQIKTFKSTTQDLGRPAWVGQLTGWPLGLLWKVDMGRSFSISGRR